MNIKSFCIGICCLLLCACKGPEGKDSKANFSAQEFYLESQARMKAGQYEDAIDFLRKALTRGMEKPMQIVSDSNFFKLIDNPEFRPKIRSLLHDFAIEHETVMVREQEEGKAIEVKGKIVDESNNKPLKHVKVELVHADNQGFYFKEKSSWNPRLFAYLLTDEKGEFRIRTIMPASYKDDEGKLVPAHIHFTLNKDTYRQYASEFNFADDSVLLSNRNSEGLAVASLIDSTPIKQYEVMIGMQKVP